MEIELLRLPKKTYSPRFNQFDFGFDRRFDNVTTNYVGDCIIIHGFKDPGYDTDETLMSAIMLAMEKIERME